MDRVEQVMQRARRTPSIACAVLYLDIDRFKLVNDSLSHAVGDHLLVALAGRVAAVLRPGDTVARIGGDEFTILLDGVDSGAEATSVADRVQQALAERVRGRRPRAVRDREHRHRAERAADDRRGADPQRRHRDVRRQAPRPCPLRGVRREHAPRVVDRLARQNELRQAVEQSLLPIHYQPIVDLATGRISGLEALVRWPGRGPRCRRWSSSRSPRRRA